MSQLLDHLYEVFNRVLLFDTMHIAESCSYHHVQDSLSSICANLIPRGDIEVIGYGDYAIAFARLLASSADCKLLLKKLVFVHDAVERPGRPGTLTCSSSTDSFYSASVPDCDPLHKTRSFLSEVNGSLLGIQNLNTKSIELCTSNLFSTTCACPDISLVTCPRLVFGKIKKKLFDQ